MNFEYNEKELTVYEDGKDCNNSGGIFTYVKTLAGLTLQVALEYELIKVYDNVEGLYTIKKRD